MNSSFPRLGLDNSFIPLPIPILLFYHTVPSGPPQSVRSRHYTLLSNSLQILWNEVNCLDTNGPIQHYIIKITGSDGEKSNTSSTRQFTTGALTPNQEYSVRVAAVNSAGNGPFSEPIIVVLVGE